MGAYGGEPVPRRRPANGQAVLVRRVPRRAAGRVLRVSYAPPIDQYREYQPELLVPGLDVDAFLAQNRIAEIGRFAVVPEERRRPEAAVALMRAACRETLERGFTHYVTDIFEDDPHSPYRFHTRVMGFQPVATHADGGTRLQAASHYLGVGPRRRVSTSAARTGLAISRAHLGLERRYASATRRRKMTPLYPAVRRAHRPKTRKRRSTGRHACSQPL
jgi:hypothetical protein